MRLRKRSPRRPVFVRPLMPWLFGAGLLVSFTASAGIRTTVDSTSPGLRFSEDPIQVSLAWPTLTAPDIAVMQEDFLLAPPHDGAPIMSTEDEAAPQLAPGLWRGAQVTDGAEPLSEATPEISVLFRLSPDLLPLASTFDRDDGGPVIGAFSGLTGTAFAVAEPLASAADTIVVAKAAAVAVPLPPENLPPVGLPSPSSLPKPAQTPAPSVARPVPPKSPLVGVVTSEKELRCLSEAVYFEARSEPERGQAAVAQVVLNRVQSGAYPNTVCGVVYQNRHRHLACQFTFACEGKALRTDEAGAWATAQRIARDVAEGRTYMPGVGNASHYHANYVRPWWARHMDRREKVGKHIFYFEDAAN
jgi:spore germination cell wall hydrolase CwlJ-like protein